MMARSRATIDDTGSIDWATLISLSASSSRPSGARHDIEGFAQTCVGPLVPVIATLRRQVVRGAILRGPTNARSEPRVSQLGLEFVVDRRRDAFLCGGHVVDARVHRFRPEIAAVRAVDERGC